MGRGDLAYTPPPCEYRAPMRDAELYQMLLGLTAPWEVSAANIAPASADRPLGEIAVEVAWAIADTAGLPELRTGRSAPWQSAPALAASQHDAVEDVHHG